MGSKDEREEVMQILKDQGFSRQERRDYMKSIRRGG